MDASPPGGPDATAHALRRTVRIGVLAAALAAVGFGTAYPVTAVALRSFTPLGAAAVQGCGALILVGSLALLGWLPRPSPASRTRLGLARLACLGLLGGVGFVVGMNVAVALAGPTISGFVAALYAVFAALFAVPVLGERLRPGTVLSFAVALLGTLLLVGFRPADTPIGGVLAALLAAVSFGLYLVLARRWGASHSLDGTSVTLANLASRGPLLLVVEVFRGPGAIVPSSLDPAALAAIVYLVLVPSALCQLLIMASVRRVPARRTSASLLLAPLTAAVVSGILLGERLGPGETLGGALIIAGIAGASGLGGAVARGTRAQLGAAMSRRGKAHQA